mmetsp:Transcript_82389/g.191345  ORF Transcript_82389/g.191345 Transcript_82389/m.191345 type:complete len:224 (-) Transcript_82389:1108-1779(-)
MGSAVPLRCRCKEPRLPRKGHRPQCTPFPRRATSRAACSVALLGVHFGGLPVQGVRLRGGVGVLAVDLHRLVALTGDQAAGAEVKLHVEDAVLGAHAAGLWDGLQALVLVAATPVPKVEVAVVRAAYQDGGPLLGLANGTSVDDGAVAGDVPLKLASRTLPDLVVIRGAGDKGVLRGVDAQGADALLVVRQGHSTLASCKIPQPHHAIHGATEELRFRGLRRK